MICERWYIMIHPFNLSIFSFYTGRSLKSDGPIAIMYGKWQLSPPRISTTMVSDSRNGEDLRRRRASYRSSVVPSWHVTHEVESDIKPKNNISYTQHTKQIRLKGMFCQISHAFFMPCPLVLSLQLFFFASNKARELCLPRPQPARRSWKHHGCLVTTIFEGWCLFTSHMHGLIWMGWLSGLKVRHPKKNSQALLNKSSPPNLLPIFDKTTLQNWSLKRISLPFSQDKAPTQNKTCFIPHGTHLNGAFVRCLGCMGCTALIAERCCWREMLRDPSLSGERSDFCFGLLAFQTDCRIMVPSGRFRDAPFYWPKSWCFAASFTTVVVFFPAGTPELCVRGFCSVLFVLEFGSTYDDTHPGFQNWQGQQTGCLRPTSMMQIRDDHHKMQQQQQRRQQQQQQQQQQQPIKEKSSHGKNGCFQTLKTPS